MGLFLMILNGYISHKGNFATEEPVPLKSIAKATLTLFPLLITLGNLLYGIMIVHYTN